MRKQYCRKICIENDSELSISENNYILQNETRNIIFCFLKDFGQQCQLSNSGT
jgi:hypothetical protein